MNKQTYSLIWAILATYFLTPLNGQNPTASFATWKDNKKAAYSIIHDDYSNYVTGIYQHAFPIATQRGIKIAFGAITNEAFCGDLEWQHAREMMAQGHECVNHSHNHRCGGTAGQCSGLQTYGTADFATELDLSTQTIQSNTNLRPRFFIHPYDAPSDAILTHLRGLGYLGTRAGTQLAVNPNTFTDFMRLNYFVYDGSASALTSLTTAVDNAIAAGGYAIREFHGIEDGSWAQMTVPNYTNHLDYVKSKMDDGSLWSTTPTEAITYKMQRDAFQPLVSYTASTGIINVTFNSLSTIDPSVLRTPVTVNVNLNGLSGVYSVTQNNATVAATRVGNIISFNIYPHQGAVTLTCNDCSTPPQTPNNITSFVATPQTNAVSLAWSNPTSNFDKVMIVAQPLSSITSVPSGTSYTADADFSGSSTTFGNGKVVYRGTGSSVSVINLIANTRYYFKAFSRLGTSWSSGVEVNAVPLAPIPTQPSNILNFVAAAQTGAIGLAWSNPTSNFDEVMIVAKALSGFTTTPVGTTFSSNSDFLGTATAFEGGKVVYRGTGTSVNVTNLTAGTRYYFRAYSRLGTVWSSGVEINGTPNAIVPPACGPDGQLIHQFWSNINPLFTPSIGYLTIDSRYPNNPTTTNFLTEFRTSNLGDRYGNRVTGYIVPKVTGRYTFYITGDDNTEFYLSTNESALNKRRRCRINGFTGETQYNKYNNQKSSSITLEAGKYYYCELLHVEGTGTDHFGVHWQTPSNNTITLIDKAFFSSKICTTPAALATTAQYFAFEGQLEVDKAVLNWASKSANETDYYVLEKADEYTGEFRELNLINAVDKTKSLQAFSYTDQNLIDGDNLYRLKTVYQSNINQSNVNFQYSEVVKVRYERPEAYTVFPNPATENVAIDLSGANGKPVDIAILSLLGKVVKQERVSTPSVSYQIELDNIESGQYFIRIQPQGKRVVMKKLMIMK
jgi:peptidoglycan/xylan/chitin deacetylase (PgdA/CDA1 family)